MAKDTKEKILEAALDMFSLRGFAGTNLRELTASLGLAKSSAYRHFASKEEIWNTLLEEMTAYYAERFGSPDHLPPVPDSPEELVALTLRMTDFTLHDEKIVKMRKLLTIEQFRDAQARNLATGHFLTGLTEIFTPVFAGMMDKGLLRRDDPKMVAFAYTAPISALIHLSDREPEKTGKAAEQIEAFSRHFIAVYTSPGTQIPDKTEDPRRRPCPDGKPDAGTQSRLIENMITWALGRLGDRGYAGRCLSFIEDALEKSSGIEIFGGDSAKESALLYADAIRGGVPERGAFVFYDCLCLSDGGPVNWGHCGIGLGDGWVIHAWDRVRIDDYLELEKMTALSSDHPKYIGWVPVERVLKQKLEDGASGPRTDR